jgi:hypothetical protein
VSKKVPVEAMKVLADALQEFKDIVAEGFIVHDFKLELATSSYPDQNVSIEVTLGEHGDFDLAFE